MRLNFCGVFPKVLVLLLLMGDSPFVVGDAVMVEDSEAGDSEKGSVVTLEQENGIREVGLRKVSSMVTRETSNLKSQPKLKQTKLPHEGDSKMNLAELPRRHLQEETPAYVKASNSANTCPAPLVSVTKEECRVAVQSLVPAGESQGRTFLVEDNRGWGHVPPGCSIQNGSNDAHWNNDKNGINNGDFPPVCKPTQYLYVKASDSANTCPAPLVSVTEEECLAAVKSVVPPGKTQGRTYLVDHNSWSFLPPGCSMTTGDYAAHWNKDKNGINNGDFPPVCKVKDFEYVGNGYCRDSSDQAYDYGMILYRSGRFLSFAECAALCPTTNLVGVDASLHPNTQGCFCRYENGKAPAAEYYFDQEFDGVYGTGPVTHVLESTISPGLCYKYTPTFSYDGVTGPTLQEQCDAARDEGREGVTCCGAGSDASYYSFAECESDSSGRFKAVGVIAENACSGLASCWEFEGTAMSGSCQGYNSCMDFNGRAMSGSCQGYSSCSRQKGDVGVGGCVGEDACYYHEGSVGAGGCVGENACYLHTGSVGAKSCSSAYACAWNRPNTANIEENACQGPCSCFGNTSETIKAGECNEPCECAYKPALYFDRHCKDKGYGGRCDNDDFFSTKTGAALSSQCSDARAEGRQDVTCCSGTKGCDEAVGMIAKDACVGAYACLSFDGTAVGGACQGKQSCHRQKGSVDTGGCIGQVACFYHTGFVKEHSCTDTDSCRESTVNIEANACQGPCSCFGNTDETIEAGTCNEPCECAGGNFKEKCRGKGYGGFCDK